MKKTKEDKLIIEHNPLQGIDSSQLAQFSVFPFQNAIIPKDKDDNYVRRIEWQAVDKNNKIQNCYVEFNYGKKVPTQKTDAVLMALCQQLFHQRKNSGDTLKVKTNWSTIHKRTNYEPSEKLSGKEISMIQEHINMLYNVSMVVRYIAPSGLVKRLTSRIISGFIEAEDVAERNYKGKDKETGEDIVITKAPLHIEAVMFTKEFVDRFLKDVVLFNYYEYLWFEEPLLQRLFRFDNLNHNKGRVEFDLRYFCELTLGITGKVLDQGKKLAYKLKEPIKKYNAQGYGKYIVTHSKTDDRFPSNYRITLSRNEKLPISLNQSIWKEDEREAYDVLEHFNLTAQQMVSLIKQYRDSLGYLSAKYIKYVCIRFLQWTQDEEIRTRKTKWCALLLKTFKEQWYLNDFMKDGQHMELNEQQFYELKRGLVTNIKTSGSDIDFDLELFEKMYPQIFQEKCQKVAELIKVNDIEGLLSEEKIMQKIHNECFWYYHRVHDKKH